jgi:tRNA-2-methylthio-N6-dimethylallyladenosine synthase
MKKSEIKGRSFALKAQDDPTSLKLRGASHDNGVKKYCIITFGCAQNIADSERIAASFEGRGYKKVDDWKEADTIVINTCVVRQMAEDRVYGLVRNISLFFTNRRIENRELRLNNEYTKTRIHEDKENREQDFGLRRNDVVGRMPKIIVTGCMVGMAARDKTGKILQRLKERMPEVDEFLPIEEVGFNLEPVRQNSEMGLVVISNGCNNFCTFCVVPFSRGREVSRPFEDIIRECKKLREQGYKSVMLLGQNVNSYGSDIVRAISAKQDQIIINGMEIKPTMVKHLGKYRIPTLFPFLLEEVAKMGFEKIDFMSSNPWDFSDELIDVISRNKNITRQIHLPVQSGDDGVLKRMNRWYTQDEYIKLVKSLKLKVKSLKLTTDLIVGFCSETDKEFQETVNLVKKVGFEKAYVSIYSSRPLTGATIAMKDDVPYAIKKKRWLVLDKLINHK